MWLYLTLLTLARLEWIYQLAAAHSNNVHYRDFIVIVVIIILVVLLVGIVVIVVMVVVVLARWSLMVIVLGGGRRGDFVGANRSRTTRSCSTTMTPGLFLISCRRSRFFAEKKTDLKHVWLNCKLNFRRTWPIRFPYFNFRWWNLAECLVKLFETFAKLTISQKQMWMKRHIKIELKV